LNKKSVLLTPDVIEECLSESLDILEKNTAFTEKKISSNSRLKKTLK
jgi:hypothetical protein